MYGFINSLPSITPSSSALLPSFTCHPFAPLRVSPLSSFTRSHSRSIGLTITASAEPSPSPAIQYGIIGSSAVALPVIVWSEIHLAQTGCGLPPGPGGVIGALEGVSFLVLMAVIAYSVFVKVKTGKGLPPGPAGLIGACEGLAYLTFLVFVAEYGYLAWAGKLGGAICYQV